MEIEEALAVLKESYDKHSEYVRELRNAYENKLYAVDLYTFAVLNRSLCLIEGFSVLITQRNFVAAAPLIRLQLDNLLRYSAVWLVDDPHRFVLDFMSGTRISQMKDSDGNKMHDSYLVKLMAKEEPRMQNLYNQTSGYIHLSEKHFFNAFTLKNNDGTFSMKVSVHFKTLFYNLVS